MIPCFEREDYKSPLGETRPENMCRQENRHRSVFSSDSALQPPLGGCSCRIFCNSDKVRQLSSFIPLECKEMGLKLGIISVDVQ